MSLLQIASLILFFYVFGLAAVLMTIYVARVIIQLIQVSQEQQSGTKKSEKPPPEAGDDSIKLHIREGLLEVNRLPDEKQEK